jgi:hypothetical protein
MNLAGGLTKFDNSRSGKCRTFGAPYLQPEYPGLTAGPIDWRSFGPPYGMNLKHEEP